MKHLFKYTLVALLAVVSLGSLTSCNDDSTEVEEPQEPRMVSIGFGLELTPQSGVQAKNAEDLHTYETTGYTVYVSGGIVGGPTEFTEVDLTQTLTIEVVGDVVVTVTHPSFVPNDLVEIAYYGISNIDVPTGGSESSQIPLELVQGFVMVTVQAGLPSNVVTAIQILSQTSTLNTVYYTAAPLVDVVVTTTGGVLTGDHPTVLGQGVQYQVTSFEDGLGFTFPVFGTPGDGEWNP